MKPTGKQAIFVAHAIARYFAATARDAKVRPERKAKVAPDPGATVKDSGRSALVPPVASNQPKEILSVAERKARMRAVIALGPGLRRRRKS